METWRDVVGFEGLYKVSNLGNIMALEKWVRPSAPKFMQSALLKPVFKKNTGYMQVTLCNFPNKPKISLVHRIVAEAFISNDFEKRYINHIDGNKTNNSVDNLEWVTHSENQKHAINTGLVKLRRGVDIKNSILTDSIVIEILKMHNDGYTQSQIMDKFGIRQQHVSSIINKKSWRHITQPENVIARTDYGMPYEAKKKRSQRTTNITHPTGPQLVGKIQVVRP